jgi:diaminopimelate epimerase
MEKIAFYKMSGSGNDFIIVDNRNKIIDGTNLPDFVKKVCRRKMSVGADGFILIENTDGADFKWQFFNSDGSRAEMCGNGARCAARFAYLNGIAKSELNFKTDAGLIRAVVVDETVKIKMPDPFALKMDQVIELNHGSLSVCFINTGVPHVVIEVDNIEDVDVVRLGREIRFHKAFSPDGTNVNFVHARNGHIAVRTYERGVEDETLACGTGAIAGALVMDIKFEKTSPVRMLTRSGGFLTIHFQKEGTKFSEVFLEGDARIVYRGELWEDAWE